MATQLAPFNVAEGFNPFDPAFIQDPRALLDYARREEPVFFSPAVNAWVVTRFADIEGVLRDPERFTSKDILSITDLLSPEVREMVGDRVPMEGTLIGVDGQMHTRLRRVLAHAFTPARIAELETDVTELTDGLLADFRRRGSAELVGEVFLPLPLWTISRLIGIPDDEISICRQGVEDWAELSTAYIMGADLEHQLTLARRIIGLHVRIEQLFDERRRRPCNDLITEIVKRQPVEQLTTHEMLSLVPGLFLAGHETIAQSLALGLYHLLSDRRRWWALVDDPSSVDSVVEEILRRDGPVFGLWRNVTEDTVISGVRVPAGSRLYLSYWAGNVDPERYADPAEIDVTRANRLHLAFGRGVHYCIGAPLARMELRVVLSTLVRDFPDLRLADDFHPVYRPHFFLRGLEELRVDSTTYFVR